jgi:hypothetical protein
VPGDAFTVWNADADGAFPFNSHMGTSLRFAFEMAPGTGTRWGVYVLPPGQVPPVSPPLLLRRQMEAFLSSNYDNMLAAWATGRYFDVLVADWTPAHRLTLYT